LGPGVRRGDGSWRGDADALPPSPGFARAGSLHPRKSDLSRAAGEVGAVPAARPRHKHGLHPPPRSVGRDGEGAETGTVRVAAPSTTLRVVPRPRFAAEAGAAPAARLPIRHFTIHNSRDCRLPIADCRLPNFLLATRYSLLATHHFTIHHSP